MAFNKLLAERVRHLMRRIQGFEEKNMFGGVAFLLHGNVCAGIWKESLVLRLGPEQAAEALQDPFVRAFDITGKPMRGWVMVRSEAFQEDDELSDWLRMARKFVGKLPPK